MPNSQVIIPSILGFLAILFIFMLFIVRIVKCNPNTVLVISGMLKSRFAKSESGGDSKKKYRIIKSGSAFIFPIVQKVDILSLEIQSIDFIYPNIQTTEATVNVDGNSLVRVKSDDASIHTAVELFLSKSVEEMKKIILQVIEGNLRTVIGSTPIDYICMKRSEINDEARELIAKDLSKMGLEILSLTLRDIKVNMA